MKYGIIAAGEGSRLISEGIVDPKPLIKVGGEPLIDRLIRIFLDNDAEEIAIICNDMTHIVSSHLAMIKINGFHGRQIPLKYVVKSTPSSMHSFHEISRFLKGGTFCVTTVDTVFREDEFKEYIAYLSKATASDLDGVMGVTDYVDDEKPLYVDTDDNMQVTGFFDKSDSCKFISGGIYGLTDKSIDTLDLCLTRGESRMRNYQRALIANGFKLKAWKFSKIIDIDHVSDIKEAEKFINQ